MLAMIGAILATSVIGSTHCAAMCGPLLMLYTGGRPTGASSFDLHAFYHMGRLVAYGLLGALAGGFGHLLDGVAQAQGLRDAAAIAAGVLVMVWGVLTVLHAVGLPKLMTQHSRGLAQPIARMVRQTASFHPRWRAALMGAITPLLPCGWLYLFVVSAAGTGAAWKGALTMAVFWAGTLPVLLSVGAGLQRLTGAARRYAPVACAVLVICVSGIGLWRRLPMHSGESHCHHSMGSIP